MFFCISACTIAEKKLSNNKGELKPIHIAAFILDVITAIALLVVGICATQWHFMPPELQFALIGAGSAYGIGLLSVMGFIGKICVTDKTLC